MAERHVVIVTGEGTGIGAATARLLRRAGHDVVVSGRRPEPLAALAEETGALPHPSGIGDPTRSVASSTRPWLPTGGWTAWCSTRVPRAAGRWGR